MQRVSEKGCKSFQFMIIIDFYVPILRRGIYKSFMYDTSLIFMQPALEEECKNSQFTVTINFYVLFFKKRLYKSSMYDI